MIDLTFRNINRLLVLTFNVNSNVNDNFPENNTFDKYSMSLVEIKDFNKLFHNKSFF